MSFENFFFFCYENDVFIKIDGAKKHLEEIYVFKYVKNRRGRTKK